MFDFILSKDGSTILERVNVRGEIVVAALQLLGEGETLTVKLGEMPVRDYSKKEK